MEPVKSLVDLLADLLLDCGRVCSAPCSRDIKTLRERVLHEGDGFITITLPLYCKHFERSLAEQRVSPGSFPSFGKVRSGTPSFLKGFLRRVFDKEGVLLDNPSVDCIRAIRQICLFCKKVERPCSDARLSAAAERFAQCDSEIVPAPQNQCRRYFRKVCNIIVARAFGRKDPLRGIMPKHGPGATRESILGNQKWIFRRWHRRLTDVGITYHRYAHGSSLGLLPCKYHDHGDVKPTLVEPWDEEPVRVVFVPKTQKTPRVIAVEPVCMQFAQQGLMRWVVEHLDKCSFTGGHLNFKDQTVNQSLALEGSRNGKYATLDLSEASDRVSLELVEELFAGNEALKSLILATRSTRAQLPSGEVIRLKKFASMGSALCFPVEALIFFTLIVASRISRAGRFPTAQTVRNYGRDVFVFGDDLVIPADEAETIRADLEAFGLKVNIDKSFGTGKFRESCGMDAYDGVPVTPVYLRRDPPANRSDASGLLSCVATANQLCQAGYRVVSNTLRKSVERVLGPLPQVPFRCESNGITPESPAIGWFGDSEAKPRSRWNQYLQRTESFCWIASPVYKSDPLEGHSALAKCFRLIGTSDPIDKRHLERSGRPHGLALKRGWVPL